MFRKIKMVSRDEQRATQFGLLIAVFIHFACCETDPFYKHMGCYKDDYPNNPDFTHEKTGMFADVQMDYSTCIGLCNSDGFPYAGLMAGSQCFCGHDYGKHGVSQPSECNYTCGEADIYGACGGVTTNDIYYASDSKPVTRVMRVNEFYFEMANFTAARMECIKQNGDLTTIGSQEEIDEILENINKSGQIVHPSTDVWVGLWKPTFFSSFKWTDPTTYGVPIEGKTEFWSQSESFHGKCGVLNVRTGRGQTTTCGAQKPFICKQIPRPVVVTEAPGGGDGGSDTGDGSDDGGALLSDNNILVYAVLLPMVLICYGGSCLVYAIGKCYKVFRQKKRQAALRSLNSSLAEFEPDTKPLQPGTSPKDVVMKNKHYSPPPPYYRHPPGTVHTPVMAIPPGDFREVNEQQSVRPRPPATLPPRQVKKYQYELEAEANDDDDDGVDFSKLSIRDIIYIKSLMGERRAVNKTKKRKVIMS